ncbi:MAG: hypothetical protein AAF718_07555 [Pseudomonadota bacterium]
MRLTLILLVMIIIPGLSFGNPIKVLAVEKESSIRLTLLGENFPKWKLERSTSKYTLTLSNAQLIRFDLTDIFRNIERSRISDIRATGNNILEIDLVCACYASPASSGQDILIIDIYEVDETKPSVQSTLSAPIAPLTENETLFLPLLDDIEPARRQMRGSGTVSSDAVIMPQRLQGYLAANSGALLGSQPVPSVAVDLLSRAFARAAAQGLIDPSSDISSFAMSPSSKESSKLRERINVTAKTGFDRAIHSNLRKVPPTTEGSICFSNDQIDIASWGDLEEPNMLGRLRGDLIAESGTVQPNGALALAKYYLFLGFGAEARKATLFIPEGSDRELIRALADIMDTGMTSSSILRGQVGCRGAVALWAVLFLPVDEMIGPTSADDVLSTFSALPAHLRTHLGPSLAKRLQAVGLPEEARIAINAVTRAGQNTDESELASARLELDGIHSQVARETLAELSTGTSITAAGALLELLKDAEERGMPPNPNWVDDAPTLVDALEGTDIAAELNIAGLQGLIALGRYDEFRLKIVEPSPGLSVESRRVISTLAMKSAALSANSSDFLKTEIGLSRLVPPDALDRETRLLISRRLTNLGLASRATIYLPANPTSSDEYTLTAQVLKELGNPEGAITLLESRPTLDGADVLGDALMTAGDARAAIAAYENANDVDSATSIAMQIGDWSWLARNGLDEISSIARALVDPKNPDEQNTTSPNGRLILSSQARRSEIENLLELTSTEKLQ